MNITPIELLQNGGLTFVVGVVIGIFAEVISFLSKKLKALNNKLVIISVLKDIMIPLSFTIGFILVLYYFCGGRIRGIFLFFLMIGFWAYKLLFARITNKTLEFLCKFCIKTIKIFISFFFQPIEKASKRVYNKIKNSKCFIRGKHNHEGTKSKRKIK